MQLEGSWIPAFLVKLDLYVLRISVFLSIPYQAAFFAPFFFLSRIINRIRPI